MSKNKTGRNDPCYCGSGRKYKKCCLKKEDIIMEKKNNDFRDEVAEQEISPAEEMKRNQVVQLVALRSQREMVQMDIDHLERKLAKLVALKQRVFSMPDCEWKTASMDIIEHNIQQHGKALQASAFGVQNAMNLDALERLDNLSLDTCSEKESALAEIGVEVDGD